MKVLERTPSYLSPSSLGTMEQQPHKFYLTRCLNTPFLGREPQSLAAAVGTGFDCLIKQALHARGIPFGTKLPEDITTEEEAEKYFVDDLYSSLENHKVEAVAAGNKVLNVYRKAGLVGQTKHDWRSVEGQKAMNIQGVPIFGKLDAIVYDEEYDMLVPFDWKVSGYTAKTGMAPKKGFREIFDGGWKDGHKLYTPTIEMQHIDLGFAKQFCTYGWMLGHFGKEFPVYFDHVVHNGDNSKIRIASYRAIVTEQFQEDLLDEYKWKWASLHNGDFLAGLTTPEDYLACEFMAMGENWF